MWILKECVQKVLLEIDHREATEPLTINMNAQDELERGISGDTVTASYFNQRTTTSEDIYDKITQGVKDNIGDSLRLTFGRKELDRSTSTIVFYFDKVVLLTKQRAVIEGRVMESRSPIPTGRTKPKRIQIDYHFYDQTFYEAVYCANNTVRDMKPLKLDYSEDGSNKNVNTAINLIQFLSMCLYSVDDAETTINNKPAMIGIQKIPFK